LLAPVPAELPFAINRERLERVLVADDAEVLAAIRFAYEELRIVVEPGGAVALAALLTGARVLQGRTAIVIVSGGNVDAAVFMRALEPATALAAA
jgi:threonine dehydratase